MFSAVAVVAALLAAMPAPQLDVWSRGLFPAALAVLLWVSFVST